MMKKRDWVLIVGVVFVSWALDALTKQWALATISTYKLNFHGLIGFILHRNPGAMLGMFSNLPPILRIVTLSTSGAFLVFVYACIQYLLPMRSMILRIGMSFLLGGILGNVTDRTLSGSVVDFIVLGTKDYPSPAFNLADAIQWVGYIMVVFALIKDGQQLWPSENTRKKLWINPTFQMRYCFILMTIGLGFSVVCGVFSYTYLQIVIDDIVLGSPTRFEIKFLRPFVFTFLAMSFSFVIFLFMIGRQLSHRMAGPVYAFEKYLDELFKGNDRPFKLRTGDEFKHLEELAVEIRSKLMATEGSALNNNIVDTSGEATEEESSDDLKVKGLRPQRHSES